MRLSRVLARSMGALETAGSAATAGIRPSLRATARGVYSSTGYSVSRTLGKYQPKRMFGALEAGMAGAAAGTLLGAATGGAPDISVSTSGAANSGVDTTNDTSTVAPSTTTGAVSEERQQATEGDNERQVHNVDVIDGATVSVALDPPTPVEFDNSIESIVSWLGKECYYKTVNSISNIQVVFDRSLLAYVADGKLNHYLLFRGDLVVTVRWNAPKTVFGSFVLFWDYGKPVEGTIDPNLSRHKVYVDLQLSAATITIPWLFPQRFVSLVGWWQIGVLRAWTGVNPTSATENQWNPVFNVYVSFKNVSVLTPTPCRSMVAQGGVMSSISSTMSYNDIPETGQDVIRTFSEGVNLARSSGTEPAVPIARAPLPMRQSNDPHSPMTMLDLTSIPTYQSMSMNNWFRMHNAWLSRFAVTHHSVRADFIVTLHCHATAFHSGRVRILYTPFVLEASSWTRLDYSRGPSILWNIDDNRSITFEVPYGSPKEFNDWPCIMVVPEPDFQTSFENSVAPAFMAEVVAFNVAVVGFKTPQPTFLANFPNPAIVDTSIVKQTGFEVGGWYTASHTSENDCDILLATTARRPGRTGVEMTSRSVVRVRDLSLHSFVKQDDAWKAVRIHAFFTYIGNVLSCHVGWRGSLKVSVYSTAGSIFKMTLYYSYMSMSDENFAWSGGTVVTAAGFGEVLVPYFSQDLYYTSQSSKVAKDSPVVVIEPLTEEPYTVYVGFMPDFEVIGTSSEGAGLDYNSFLEERVTVTHTPEESTQEGVSTPEYEAVFGSPLATERGHHFQSTSVQGE